MGSSAVYTAKGEQVAGQRQPGSSRTHLRMHSRACVKTCGAMPCSCCRIRHCSRVTDMAVRSLALLQLVNRTPLRRRQTCSRKQALRRGKTSRRAAPSRACHRPGRNINNKAIPSLFPGRTAWLSSSVLLRQNQNLSLLHLSFTCPTPPPFLRACHMCVFPREIPSRDLWASLFCTDSYLF